MNKRDFLKTGLLGLTALALPKTMRAIELYPRKTSKSWVVVYSTWCGSSRDAAVWIAEGMGGIADVFDVRECPDITKYDNVIIGGSIRSAKLSSEMNDLIDRYKLDLETKLRGCFVVCGNMMKQVTKSQKNELIDSCYKSLKVLHNIPSEVFLGRVTYRLMDEEAAKSLKGYQMPEYDNLKRNLCLDFGEQILKM